jgi:hypothetical protein
MKMYRVIAMCGLSLMVFACGAGAPKDFAAPAPAAAPERPTDAELLAFKVYHHMVYMVTTAEQAGGTNKLLHTKQLPTEGTDPVVSPALDHIYSKVVVDLTEGPVTVEMPKVEKGRYYSIHVTDQEHYTIYDEIHPVGRYTIVRQGKEMEVPEGATTITSPGDYPHLFIRIQVKTNEDLPNAWAIQERIKLAGSGSKELIIENPINHTLETHDVYPGNKVLLKSATAFTEEDYLRVSNYIGVNAPRLGANGNLGKFGPIDSGEPGSDDIENRAAAIVGHLGFPVHHAFYMPYFSNCSDEVLNGDKAEVFTFPYKPEGVELFWSITRYSAITRNTVPGKNDLFNAYNTEPDANGNITVTFGVADPKDGTYWMPVNAGEPYYLIVRYYKPDVNNLPKKPCKQ